MTYSFERLKVWEKTKNLTVTIYSVTSNFPNSEKFGMTSQLSRAAISIASNIAEGSSRKSIKDPNRFYTMAFSSAMEVLNQLIISKVLNLLESVVYQSLRDEIEQITAMLTSLHSSNRTNL